MNIQGFGRALTVAVFLAALAIPTSARAQYSTAYTSLVSLGQAVPAAPETPALIYTLDKASHSRDVQFSSITTGSTGSSGATATPVAASAGFTQEPFTFVFNGSFVDLFELLNQLEGFTVQTRSGALHVNGRLLTIDSVNLAPNASEGSSSSASSKPKSAQLTGTITATAYVLPTGKSALGGATPAGPASAGAPTPTSTASSAPAGSSAGTAAAVVKVNP